jgi:hypothetical protein
MRAPRRRQPGDELEYGAQQEIQVGDPHELLKKIYWQERQQCVLGRADLIRSHVPLEVDAERLRRVVQAAARHRRAAGVRADDAGGRLEAVGGRGGC